SLVIQDTAQCCLPRQHDLQQLRFRQLEVAQKPYFLEHVCRQFVGFIHHQHRHLIILVRLDQKLLEQAEALRFARGNVRDAKIEERQFQKFGWCQRRVKNYAESCPRGGNRLKDPAEQRGLPRTRVTGEHHEALPVEDRI